MINPIEDPILEIALQMSFQFEIALQSERLLDVAHLQRLRRPNGAEQALDRVEDAIRIVLGELALMRPSVAPLPKLPDDAPLHGRESVPKDLIPRREHHS